MDRYGAYLALALQILLISAKTESQHGAPTFAGPETDITRLSPSAVKSMPYRDFRIKFYHGENGRHVLVSGNLTYVYDNSSTSTASENQNHQPTAASVVGGTLPFLYTPMGLLDHKSATSHHNNVTGESELRFVIHLWDDTLEEAIAEYLGKVLKTPVRREDLEVIPFERIYLELNAQLQEFLQFESRRTWVHYYVQEKYIWPRLKCPSARDCDILAEQMRLNPAQFSDCFQLKFITEAQQQKRGNLLLKKEISIKARNVISGRLYRQVESKFRLQNYVLLTQQDTRQLISESVNDIISQNFDDGTVLVDDSNMHSTLEQLLLPSKQNTLAGQLKNPTDQQWELLYWDQDKNYRPDKLATIINQIYDSSDSNGKQKFIEAFRLITDRSRSYSDADLSVMFEKLALTTGRADYLDNMFEGKNNQPPDADENDFYDLNVTAIEEGGNETQFEISQLEPSQALSSQRGFHVISDQINQKNADAGRAGKLPELEENKTLIFKMLKASANVLKWTGEEFLLMPQEFSKLNLAKLRGSRTESKAIAQMSVSYLEADMVMSLKIDTNFYWSPESDLKSRLQDALRLVDEKVQQLKSKMTSDHMEVKNIRDKMLQDYTTHYKALEDYTSEQIRQLHSWVKQEMSSLKNWTDDQLSLQISNRNAQIDSLERKLLHIMQQSSEVHDDNLRQLKEQVERGRQLNRMPSSCRDLWTIGHSHTGYYIVKSNDRKQSIQIIYCDMAERGNNTSISHSARHQQDYSRADANEKWIGYPDVKSSSVYFYAQRLTTFSLQGSVIPFQAEMLNDAGAFSLPDGTFRAPTPGIYHFSFSGLRAAAHHFVHVTLQVNGKRIGSAYSGTPESNKIPYRPTSLSLQSTLELKQGDQVRLFLEAGAIGAEIPCQDCVHFSGMLLAEYL